MAKVLCVLYDDPVTALARYAAGTREILECFFDGRPIRDEYLIVSGGGLAGAHSYSAGNATAGSEEAAGGALRARLSAGGPPGTLASR
jgi:hypothetical protein